VHSWLCRHRLRLAALYGCSTAGATSPAVSAAARARIERPRKGVVTLVPALRRAPAPRASSQPRRRAG
jgi:hypothetical protein